MAEYLTNNIFDIPHDILRFPKKELFNIFGRRGHSEMSYIVFYNNVPVISSNIFPVFKPIKYIPSSKDAAINSISEHIAVGDKNYFHSFILNTVNKPGYFVMTGEKEKYKFLRIVYLDLGDEISLLYCSAEREKIEESNLDLKQIKYGIKKMLEEFDRERYVKGMIENLAEFNNKIGKNFAGIFFRPVALNIMEEEIVVDRIYGNGYSKPINSFEQKIIPNKARINISIPDLPGNLSNNITIKEMANAHLSLWLAGAMWVGLWSLPVLSLKKIGLKTLNYQIKNSSRAVAPTIKPLSPYFSLLKYWLPENDAFSLKSISSIVGHYKTEMGPPVVLPVWDYPACKDIIHSRVRSCDAILYDEELQCAMIFLRDCTTPTIANNTLGKDLKNKGLLVGEAFYERRASYRSKKTK